METRLTAERVREVMKKANENLIADVRKFLTPHMLKKIEEGIMDAATKGSWSVHYPMWTHSGFYDDMMRVLPEVLKEHFLDMDITAHNGSYIGFYWRDK